MLRKAARLHYTTLLTPPLERRRFKYGSISIYKSPKGAASVIVPKRVLRGAVDRKRLQRRMRHAFKSLRITPSYAVALYPTKDALTAEFKDIVAALEGVCVSR